MFGFEAYETMVGFVIMNAVILAGVYYLIRAFRRKGDNDTKHIH